MDDFESEFNNEDLPKLDELLAWLNSQKKSEISIINPKRAEMMKFSYLSICRALRESGCNAKVTFGRSKEFPSFGFIDVEGVSIEIANGEWFARAAEFANNTEVYTLADNKVRMSFGFYDLLVSSVLDD